MERLQAQSGPYPADAAPKPLSIAIITLVAASWAAVGIFQNLISKSSEEIKKEKADRTILSMSANDLSALVILIIRLTSELAQSPR